jgi:hypothetical protein
MTVLCDSIIMLAPAPTEHAATWRCQEAWPRAWAGSLLAKQCMKAAQLVVCRILLKPLLCSHAIEPALAALTFRSSAADSQPGLAGLNTSAPACRRQLAGARM